MARAAADRVRTPTHPPSTRIVGVLVVRIGLRFVFTAIVVSVAAMPSPLMNIWDATFKEKAAGGRVDVCGLHERPRCHGSLNQSQRHRTPSRSRAFHCDDANAAMSELLENLASPLACGGVRSWPSSRSTAWLTHRYRHRSTAMLPSSSIGSSCPLSLLTP